MATQNDGPTKTFIAGEDITQWACVMLDSSGEVVETTGVASEDNTFIGIAQEEASEGDPVTVRMVNCVATSKCLANGAFSAGAKVYTMDDGEVDDVTTSLTCVGVALEAASGAGSVVEVAHIRGGNDDIS